MGGEGDGTNPEQLFAVGYAAVELDVTLPLIQDPDQAAWIVAAAHQVCPYSNATRGNIEVTLTANGRNLGAS